MAGCGVDERGPALSRPGPPTAIEDTRLVEPKRSQHSPKTGRPSIEEGVTEHYPRTVAEAKASHHRTELVSGRKHKRQLRRPISEIFQEVDVSRTWDMAFLPCLSPVLGPPDVHLAWL
jgi:hypothetical protein